MNGGNHRHRERGNLCQRALPLLRQRLCLLGRMARGDHGDICTGNKGIWLTGQDHQAFQGGKLLCLEQHVVDLLNKLRLQRIDLLPGTSMVITPILSGREVR